MLASNLPVIKKAAAKVKAYLVSQEDELKQSKETKSLFEEQLSDQSQKYIELQGALQTTSSQFNTFKERHYALQEELQ